MGATTARQKFDEHVNPPTMLWWQDSAGRCDIEIHRDVLVRFGALKGPGLLTGLQTGTDGSIEIHAWEYVLLPINSPRELQAMDPSSIAAWASPNGLTRVGLAVPDSWSPEDATAAARHLKGLLSGDGALILRCVRPGRMVAGVWVEAASAIDWLKLEFDSEWKQLAANNYVPFQPLRLATGQRPATLENELVLGNDQSPQVQVPAPEVNSKRSFQSVRVSGAVAMGGLITAVLLLLLSAAAGWYMALRKPSVEDSAQKSRADDPRRLQFDVKRAEDGGLDIRWDGGAARALSAQAGELQVVDGGEKKLLTLSIAELNSGKLIYIPRTGNVELILTFQTPNGAVQEGIRIIDALNAAKQPSTARLPVPQWIPQPQTAALSTPATTRRFQPQPQPTPPKSVEMPAPPPVQVKPLAQATPELDISKTVVRRGLTDTVLTPPAPAPAPAAVVQQPEQRTPVRTPVVVPPKPVRQVTPSIPSHLRPMLRPNTVVTVRLKVDERGNVSSAEAVGGEGVNGHLSRLAVTAGQNWRFEPATLNGRPVPAEHVIHFRFGQ